MTEPKPLASLSSGLLARKGGARPAMRPQLMPMTFEEQRRMGYGGGALAAVEDHGFAAHGFAAQGEDDLGWNDLGEHAPAPSAPAPAAQIVAVAADPLPVTAEVPARPEVLRRIESLDSAMRNPPTAKPEAKPRRQRGAALMDGRKAAFTLRLDGERHLRLRLACTVENRSAQQLVVDALDRLLESKPGLDDLARRARQS